MYQFFVEPEQIDVAGKSVIIRGNDVNHIKNVLRMRPGEEVAVSNGIDGREYRCGILALEEDCVRLELRFIKEDGVELPAKIYLFQGLPKADKMELIIQKAVELGAFQVIPVAMKRSVVRLDDKKAAKKAGFQLFTLIPELFQNQAQGIIHLGGVVISFEFQGAGPFFAVGRALDIDLEPDTGLLV